MFPKRLKVLHRSQDCDAIGRRRLDCHELIADDFESLAIASMLVGQRGQRMQSRCLAFRIAGRRRKSVDRFFGLVDCRSKRGLFFGKIVAAF